MALDPGGLDANRLASVGRLLFRTTETAGACAPIGSEQTLFVVRTIIIDGA